MAGLCLNVDSRMILKEGPGDLRYVAIRRCRHFVVLVLELVKDNVTCPPGGGPSTHQGVGVGCKNSSEHKLLGQKRIHPSINSWAKKEYIQIDG